MRPIQLKRILTTNVEPIASEILLGELCLNVADGKIFLKLDTDAIICVGMDVNQLLTAISGKAPTVHSHAAQVIPWDAPGAIGESIPATGKFTNLTATAAAKLTGIAGIYSAVIETQPNAYAQAHLAFLDPANPTANASLRLIQTGLRAYQMALGSSGAGSFTFTNLSSGGFTTNFQSNQNSTSLPLTLANLNAGINYGAQFNFQLGDDSTLYNSGGIAYRQETAFTNVASTRNAAVTLSSMTAGSATEKLRITSAGRFLVGTATDNGVDRLQINGSASFVGTITAGDRIATPEVACGVYRNNVGVGTNVGASSTEIRTGRGTGIGSLGDINFTTADQVASGAGQHTITPKMVVKGRGALMVGSTTDNNVDRLQINGSASFAGAVKLAAFTVSTVPSAAANLTGLIHISNEVGGATPAFSDGTNWRRIHDRAVIS